MDDVVFEDEFFATAEKRCGIQRTASLSTSYHPSSIVTGLITIAIAGTLALTPALSVPRAKLEQSAFNAEPPPLRSSSPAPGLAQLDGISRLRHGWDGNGSPPPSADAVASARKFVAKAAARGLDVVRVVPSAERGVSLYFAIGAKLAYLSIPDEGDAVLSLRDKAKGLHDVETVDLRKAQALVERVRSFLAG